MANARETYGSKWSEKEYLMVLHYYLKHRGEAQHADTPFVQELSQLLGRTPHSILYRLQNYSSIDPGETNPQRKGKVHITEFGRGIFEKWSKKPDSLRDTAEAFLRDERAQLEPDLFNPNPVRLPITFSGHYELLDEIGRGGFGVVCSCLDTRDDETYAIKVIDAARVHDRECLHRFQREIRALKSVQHSHVIRIYEHNLDSEEDYPAFVMDLAEYDLPRYLSLKAKECENAGRPILKQQEANRILLSIMKALKCLHEADPQIIHRDVNPNNILRLFDGTWVLADFSLAKFLPPTPVSTTFMTKSNVNMGTSHYASPEQYRDLKSADGRSDIHALGWLIRDLYSAEEPYPRRQPSGLPQSLENVFLKATEYKKEDRYQTVDSMKNEVDAALGEMD